MKMLSVFDEGEVNRRVSALPWDRALAFGCACAHRLLWSYERFCEETADGDASPLAEALDLLWTAARTAAPPPRAECERLAAGVEAQAPNSEIHTSLLTTSAQDAVFAICSLLDYCVESTAEALVLTARYPCDSVDLYVQESEGMHPRAPDLEEQILQHPMMQQELARQERDLTALEVDGDSGLDALYARRGTEAALELAT
jgi:uncharacterized protein YjaG (DUF416 family)